MKKTNEKGRLVNLFRTKKFVNENFKADLDLIIDKYNELGYRDAVIVKDSVAKYDDKIKERLFSELDVKYINRFNIEMEKDGCCGNIRKYYLKTLRAVVNKAIKEREASSNTYPFGKGGFEIGKLAEETAKRYLSPQDLELIKNSPQQNPVLELSRRVFLFMFRYEFYRRSHAD